MQNLRKISVGKSSDKSKFYHKYNKHYIYNK